MTQVISTMSVLRICSYSSKVLYNVKGRDENTITGTHRTGTSYTLINNKNISKSEKGGRCCMSLAMFKEFYISPVYRE